MNKFPSIRSLILVLSAAVTLAGCNQVSQPDSASEITDVDLIQGTWKLQSMIRNDGSSVSFAGIPGLRVSGDRMDEWLDQDPIAAAGDTEVVSKFQLSPEANPKRIVLVSDWYNDNGPYPSHTQNGFYELTTDTLTIKWGPDDFPKDDPEEYSQTCVYSRHR